MSPDTNRPSRRPSAQKTLIACAAALVLAGSVTAMALGSSSGSLTLGSAENSTLGKTVAVNSAGHTLYSLSGETAHHLLCKSADCTTSWPPLTVRSKGVKLKDGTGVHGPLSLVKRKNGRYQVLLRGKPLYRFAGDEKAGQAEGEGIKSFGGTWHAVAASTTPATTTTPTPNTTPSPAPSTPSYPY